MNVLIVGSGGREHALAWSIAKSPRLDRLYVAPGNGGTASTAENVPIASDDIESLLAFAVEKTIDLTVVGPEAPLVAGIVDRFTAQGLRCFGPGSAAARLEGSKVFAKQFMKKHGIPTADFTVVNDPREAKERIRAMGLPVVIKADGLAAGKGVVVAESSEAADTAIEDIMVEKKFGDSGRQVVIEAFLTGQEVSMHSICDGKRAVVLPSSQDHKRVFDGDKGPNTGGMGAYAPVPFVDAALEREIHDSVVVPTIRGMEADGASFSGVLYTGLMMTEEGPSVLEYNVRFGDPETQVILPLVESDLLAILDGAAAGSLPEGIKFYDDRFAATVVVAADGYPGQYNKGMKMSGIEAIGSDRRVVFHAGTASTEAGLVTCGGRVAAVTAWDRDLAGAIRTAYEGVDKVGFDGAYFRKDIGRRALIGEKNG